MNDLDLKNQISSNETLLKSANSKLKSQIKAKESELERIEEYYDKRRADQRSDYQADLSRMQSENNRKLYEESNNYQNRITEYKDDLEKVHTQLEQTKTSLTRENDQKIKLHKRELQTQLEDQIATTRQESEALMDKTQEHNRSINAKTQDELNEIQKHAATKIRNYSDEQNELYLKNQSTFQASHKKLIKDHHENMYKTEEDLKKETAHKVSDLKKQDADLEKVNVDQINFKKTFHTKQMDQLDNDFKERYGNITRNHQEILKDLTTRLNSDIEVLSKNNSKLKETFNDKNQDPFYHITELAPMVTEEAKSYTVKLPVAEHEKNNVFLSSQGREIKITLSRKYDQTITDGQNTQNRSTRSELFSKTFGVKDLLSPRNITQTYQDGILTFTVLKA